MAYREVAIVDVKEVFRLWMDGLPRKRIAAAVGLDPKTVRHYLRTAERATDGGASLTDARVAVVLVALKAVPARPHGAAWVDCARHEALIRTHLGRKGKDILYEVLTTTPRARQWTAPPLLECVGRRTICRSRPGCSGA